MESKYFLLKATKMERKLSGDKFFVDWQKCSYTCAHGLLLKLPLFLFFFLLLYAVSNVVFFFLGNVASSFYFIFFYSFFFSFDFLWPRHEFFFFFFFLTRCDFFWGHVFYFYFNKFGWLLFFCGYLSLFLIGHRSLTKVCE